MGTHHDARTGWRWAFALVLGLLALRLVIVITSGLPLAADEAHYWDWSRHLDWSYPTKGPGIAYAIAGATALFGDEAWAVRTVAMGGASIGVLLAFGLTRSVTHGLEPAQSVRCAKWGAVLVALLPAYQVTGLLATIDAPYIACWIAASWAALAMLRRLETPRNAMAPAILLGLSLGVGFLFKYTILFLLPSLLIALLLRRSRLHCIKRTAGTLVVASAALVLCAMPVLVWNQREGWPTVAHLLGHLGAPGGDVPTDDAGGRAWTIGWFVEFVGSQFGIIGPALGLMYLAVRTRAGKSLARTWCIAAAMPIILGYLMVSLMTDAEANWPIAGYATLLALAATRIPGALDEHRTRLRAWRESAEPRPKQGVFRRAPESPWQLWTHWTLGYGVGLACLLIALPVIVRTPVGDTALFQRLQRTERLSAEVMRAIDVAGEQPEDLVIITSRYTIASRLAHALHLEMGDRAPLVTSAASLMGDRKSAYDYWPETDPRRVRSDTVIFVGGVTEQKWTRRFGVASITPMSDAPDPEFGGLYLARGFAGATGGTP